MKLYVFLVMTLLLIPKTGLSREFLLSDGLDLNEGMLLNGSINYYLYDTNVNDFNNRVIYDNNLYTNQTVNDIIIEDTLHDYLDIKDTIEDNDLNEGYYEE